MARTAGASANVPGAASVAGSPAGNAAGNGGSGNGQGNGKAGQQGAGVLGQQPGGSPAGQGSPGGMAGMMSGAASSSGARSSSGSSSSAPQGMQGGMPNMSHNSGSNSKHSPRRATAWPTAVVRIGACLKSATHGADQLPGARGVSCRSPGAASEQNPAQTKEIPLGDAPRIRSRTWSARSGNESIRGARPDAVCIGVRSCP